MATGIDISKANLYDVLTPPKAIDVSKSNLYDVLTPPVAVDISKSNLYGVVQPPVDVNVSKALLYAVIQPFVPTQQPNKISARHARMFDEPELYHPIARRLAPVIVSTRRIRPVIFVIT